MRICLTGLVLLGVALSHGTWPSPARAQDSGTEAPAANGVDTDRSASAVAANDGAAAVDPVATEASKPSGELLLPGAGTLTVGGALRVRGEYRSPVSYDLLPAPPTDPDVDSSLVFMRTRLWLNLAVNDRVAARVEFQDSRTWGTEGGVSGNLAGFDLLQGYVAFTDVLELPLDLTLGRFAVPRFGDQRIMSDLDWHNYGRAFDGAHLRWNGAALTVHAFGALLTEASVVGAAPNNYADDDHWFTGLVAEVRPRDTALKADFYLFGRFSEARTTASEKGPPDWWRQGTVGTWVTYAMSKLTATGELYGQFGRQGTDDIQAWAGAINSVATLSEGITVLAEYSYASGDTRPTDGTINTFDPLFPFAHSYNGHIDAVIWKNVHVVKAGVAYGLAGLAESWKGWTLHVDVLGFWLASRRDAWYGATGGAWRRDPTRTVAGSGAIGSEIDIYLKGKLYGAVSVWAGYSHFFPGVYVHDTTTPTSGGGEHDQNWVFLQLVTTF